MKMDRREARSRRCRFDRNERLSAAAREVGCQLDHCSCGRNHHMMNPKDTEACALDPALLISAEQEEARAAERSAGWDHEP